MHLLSAKLYSEQLDLDRYLPQLLHASGVKRSDQLASGKCRHLVLDQAVVVHGQHDTATQTEVNRRARMRRASSQLPALRACIDMC